MVIVLLNMFLTRQTNVLTGVYNYSFGVFHVVDMTLHVMQSFKVCQIKNVDFNYYSRHLLIKAIL